MEEKRAVTNENGRGYHLGEVGDTHHQDEDNTGEKASNKAFLETNKAKTKMYINQVTSKKSPYNC